MAASIEHLLGLDLDTRSTVAYGVAHILAAVTVTNKELHAKALAEKDMSVEQYEQLAELQRVKTKDEDGNEIIEKKEESDSDTDALCRLRIKRLVALDAIPALVRLMSQDSKQTKEYAARTLRQLCVEESVRGQMGQQGGLKACTVVATDEECEKPIRREAAHAMAKALVTTNPTILSEHLRLGCIKPLVFLCRDVDSSNLQQFEALMALTNLSSCGPVEQERFVAEKGVTAVHYLMFSDHMMVRRAATEVLCNLAAHEKLLKLLRVPDKVRLWLGKCLCMKSLLAVALFIFPLVWHPLCLVCPHTCMFGSELACCSLCGMTLLQFYLGLSEDWDNEENPEALATACAASGTLASACADPGVAKALLDEECAVSVLSLLASAKIELVHRCLVVILELIDAEEWGEALATHMLEQGVVPLLAKVGASRAVLSPVFVSFCDVCVTQVISTCTNPDIADLAKKAAMALSAAIAKSGRVTAVDGDE